MFWTLFGSIGKVGPSHDKTGVFCKHEHRAGEIDVRGIVYTIETICFIKKNVHAHKEHKKKTKKTTKETTKRNKRIA